MKHGYLNVDIFRVGLKRNHLNHLQ